MDGSRDTPATPVEASALPSDVEHDYYDIPVQSLTQAVASSPAAAHSVDDDFELLNLLTVFSPMPQDGLNDSVKKELQEARGDLENWQAWEAKNIEDTVARKVKTHELPQDKTVASALKRNAYRAKVAHTYRERSSWLVGTSIQTNTTTLTGLRAQAASAIARSVSTLLPSAFRQVSVILYPTIRSLMDDTTNQRSFVFTFASHEYDGVAMNVRTVIWELNLDITVTAGVDRKQVEASINHVLTTSSFSNQGWEKNAEAIPKSVIDAGKEITRRFTLHLA